MDLELPEHLVRGDDEPTVHRLDVPSEPDQRLHLHPRGTEHPGPLQRRLDLWHQLRRLPERRKVVLLLRQHHHLRQQQPLHAPSRGGRVAHLGALPPAQAMPGQTRARRHGHAGRVAGAGAQHRPRGRYAHRARVQRPDLQRDRRGDQRDAAPQGEPEHGLLRTAHGRRLPRERPHRGRDVQHDLFGRRVLRLHQL